MWPKTNCGKGANNYGSNFDTTSLPEHMTLNSCEIKNTRLSLCTVIKPFCVSITHSYPGVGVMSDPVTHVSPTFPPTASQEVEVTMPLTAGRKTRGRSKRRWKRSRKRKRLTVVSPASPCRCIWMGSCCPGSSYAVSSAQPDISPGSRLCSCAPSGTSSEPPSGDKTHTILAYTKFFFFFLDDSGMLQTLC